MIKSFLHKCRRLLVRILHIFVGLIPKDDNLILFSAWFGQKYIDNPMYVYEYCVKNDKFKPVWYARSKDLYLELKDRGLPVVYSKTLKALWYHIRAKMFISSVQLNDFCGSLLSNAIYFDLGHGFPIKESGFEEPDATDRSLQYTLLCRKDVDYYVCNSSRWVRDVLLRAFMLEDKSSVLCNVPRTDVLFDEELRRGKNLFVDEIKNGRKAIVYMPTHRSMGKVKMPMDQILDLDSIQEICEKNNCVFIIKKHYYHRNEEENLDAYENIYDITNMSVDPEVLTYQADILISDYSAAYIDYLLLDRPVVFYAYDLEQYQKSERQLYVNFEDNHAGYKPHNKNELTKALFDLCANWSDEKHREGRSEIRSRYFDERVTVGNTREKVTQIMKRMIDGTYESEWVD